MKPALVILDRDGVLNEELGLGTYIKSPSDLRMIPGAAAAVARLNVSGIKVAVCTNQSVVGRGIIDERMLDQIHARLFDELAREGGRIDALFACTDHPERPSARRKPSPGMLEEALQRFRATAAETPVVGDHLRDLEAAAKLGCPRHLVRTGYGAQTQAAGFPPSLQPVHVHDDLGAAVEDLLGSHR